MIFYSSFKMLSGTKETDFDPSGHIMCALVAQTQHLSSYLFTQSIPIKEQCREMLICEQTTFKREVSILEKVTLVLFCFFQLNACYSIFFAAFIYHSCIESIAGFIFGIFIVGVTYEINIVSETLFKALKFTFNVLFCVCFRS